MSLELCILASGSAGNAAVLRCPAGVLLIDAGLGPRTLALRLAGTGVGLPDIMGLCLTHLDADHFTPTWSATLVGLGIPVFCHVNKVGLLVQRCPNLAPLARPFGAEPFAPVPGIRCTSVECPHDDLGSNGFLFEGYGDRLGFATDLGHVPRHLLNRFRDLDCLALESNYDPQMQAMSSRPLFLKRRITGGRGHLSNAKAFAAVQGILDRSRNLPDHIVLLHRSQECNCPILLRALFSGDPRIAVRLTLAAQHERTPWLARTHRPALPGEQLLMRF